MTPSRLPVESREAGPYSRHIPALDGVRGLAILAVMASHLFPASVSNNLAIRLMQSVLTFGAAGVDLFFALSGFLITGILYDSLHDPHFFRNFYARRALRIFPLYYGVLLILLILTPWLGITWHGLLLSLALYLQNTSLIAPPVYLVNSQWVTLTHFWSLAVEEQFYLVWPLAVFLLHDRRRLLWTCALVSLASILLRSALIFHQTPFQQINTSTLCRADSLLAGAALALLLRGPSHDATLRAGQWIFAASIMALVLEPHVLSHISGRSIVPIAWALKFVLDYSFLAIASAGLIAWCLSPSLPKRVFQLHPLRFLGKYSYGLYVLHLLILPSLLRVSRVTLVHLTSNKGLIVILSGLFAFCVSLATAWLSLNFYEKPFLRLKRLFDYRESTPDPGGSSRTI